MKEKKPFNFKMGSDPEFSFVLQERRVSAKELMMINLKDRSDIKRASNEMGFKCKGGEFGWDGCSATAELRPDPEDNIDKITDNIKHLLTNINKYMPNFDLSVLSSYAPVGGHIHFQISPDIAESSNKQQILHKKISSFYLPILMSENKINLRLRIGAGGYGTLTDFNGSNSFQKLGKTEYTYEFRTPSAEWLCTEKICRATFAYLGTVYNEIINNPRNFKKYMDIVYKNNEQAKSLHQLIVTDYIGITESIFNRIKTAIKTFETYPLYKDEIDYIMNPKKVVEDKKKSEYDIVTGWNLNKNKNKKPNQKELLNNKKFQQKAKEINMDSIVPMINITYNDDINVNEFAKILAERIAAFNWKLNRKYFLFGMKKGFDSYLVFNQENELIKGLEVIKTKSDQLAMETLISKIANKFSSHLERKIDIKTGMLKKQELTIIGIPYSLRIKRDFKSFLKLIYDIEENKYPPIKLQNISSKNITDDTELPENQFGNFYKYVHNIEKDETKIPFDTDSQGIRLARESLTMLEVESQNEDN